MSSKYRRPENMTPPVDWQACAKRLNAELVQVQNDRDHWREVAESYKDAATELYAWTKGQA